jgi:hypothetical protein
VTVLGIMRWLVLYVRSRGVPLATGAAIAGTAPFWALGQLVADPATRLTLAVLATVLATATIAPGLAGADPALERTAALAWPPRRATHLVAGTTVVAAVLAASTVAGRHLAEMEVLVRDAAGFGGLVGLSVAVLGTGRAWLPPVGWTAVILVGGWSGGEWYTKLLTWMVQPAGAVPATLTALALAAAGTIAYAFRGAAAT